MYNDHWNQKSNPSSWPNSHYFNSALYKANTPENPSNANQISAARACMQHHIPPCGDSSQKNTLISCIILMLILYGRRHTVNMTNFGTKTSSRLSKSKLPPAAQGNVISIKLTNSPVFHSTQHQFTFPPSHILNRPPSALSTSRVLRSRTQVSLTHIPL